MRIRERSDPLQQGETRRSRREVFIDSHATTITSVAKSMCTRLHLDLVRCTPVI